MTAQLISLFCFGLVVTFIVFLGVIRAKEFRDREMGLQSDESIDSGATGAGSPQLSAVTSGARERSR